MKRTIEHYYCDVCLAEIDADGSLEDWTGRNWGLCDECRERGYHLKRFPLSESDGCVIRLYEPTGDEQKEASC